MNKDIKPHIVEYSEGKRLKESATMLDGVRDGVSQWFYPNGMVMVRANYKMGKFDGQFVEFDESGKIIKELYFAEGIDVTKKVKIESILGELKI